MRIVRCVTQKWPDGGHWEFDARWLGADAHGEWLGVPEGTWLERPGRGFHAAADHVVLVPHDGWWLATMYGNDAQRPVDLYIDITTPAEWEGDQVRCIDLDLDVIRSVDGEVFIDDEDEFAEHRVSLNYPADVVRSASETCRALYEAVVSERPPFDGTAARWIEKLKG